MAEATEQHHSTMTLLAKLFVVVLALHIFFVGFAIQSTRTLQSVSEDRTEEVIQGQENVTEPNATEPAKASGTPEILEDREDNKNIELKKPQEDSVIQVEPNPAPAQTANDAGWGIYSNNPDVGVYSDSACTQSLASFDWGTVSLGGAATQTIYVKNTGSNNLTLSLRTKNWNPPTANGPVTLSWNLEGTTLSINRVSAATLTLNVSNSTQGIATFSFDAVISGTE